MKLKTKKLLFQLSENSRITTKNLAKTIRASQQSASYLINKYTKEGFVSPVTVADPVRIGHTNVIVGMDYLRFDLDTQKKIINELQKRRSIVGIEENNLGVDLLLEYCVPNMSAFNKSHNLTVHTFIKEMKARFIFPVIVKHQYARNYLARKRIDRDTVLSGDRKTAIIKKSETDVLDCLVKNPQARLSLISQQTGVPSRSVLNIKNRLEKTIIKGYSCILDHKRLSILRHHVLLNFSAEGVTFIERFVQYARNHKNIVELTKLLGRFQVMITIEELESSEVVRDIRSNFPTEDYLVLRSGRIHKKSYIPAELKRDEL